MLRASQSGDRRPLRDRARPGSGYGLCLREGKINIRRLCAKEPLSLTGRDVNDKPVGAAMVAGSGETGEDLSESLASGRQRVLRGLRLVASMLCHGEVELGGGMDAPVHGLVAGDGLQQNLRGACPTAS